MAIADMTPEEVQGAIEAGYRAAGNIFRFTVDVLEARYGKKQAHDVAREIVRLKAQAAGEIAASRFGKGGFENLMRAQKAGFPELEVLAFNPTRYVIRDHRCPIVEAWRQSGVSPERIKELGDLYCWGDLYFAQVFNPDIRLEFEGRIAEGRPFCQWVFTLSEL
ncbi:MAG: hypothetical protein Kow0063_24440 [Anaerolineae bacterium]